jgi:nucleotide-binding universal stress UspA family protein
MTTDLLDVIVVGHDGSDGGQLAVQWSGRLAAALGATVIVVRGYNPLDDLGSATPPVDFAELERQAAARLDEMACAPLREMGVSVRSQLVENDAVSAIVDTARNEHADLVVVGSHGQTGWRARILGSTATKLPHELDCPVVIVPLPDPV